MVFWSSWAKKVRESVSKLTFDKLKNRVNTIENKYVKKDESNTLTQTNTFNGNTYFRNRVEFKNDRNNNGIYIDNFDFGNDNYTALKFTNNNANMLQIECDNTTNKATISSPSTNNGLSIQNLDNPTRNDNATNKGYVDNLFNPLNNKVNSVIQGLQNGNIINYEGNYSPTKTYHLAQAITYNGDWFVSNQDNNVGHTPSKTNSTYWVYISAPTVDLNLYLTKSEASNTYLLKTMLNTLYPVGSNVMTTNGSTHALVNMYPTKFKELTDSDISYLAIGTNSSNSNTGTFTINQNNLPNIHWSWSLYWNNGITSNETDFNAGTTNMYVTYQYIQTNKKNSSQANNSGARVNVNSTIYLNGNVSQIPITYTMKPKTLKIRIWEVIANLI